MTKDDSKIFSTIDLIILGNLLDKSMGAYALTNFIDSEQIYRILKISKPAIFKSCKRLFQSGYLDGETIREKGYPDKVIYSINEKGKKHFFELMDYFSMNIKPFYLEFNSFIWNIDKLDKKDGLAMLENLQDQLRQFQQWIILHEQEVPPTIPFAGKMLIKQYGMMLMTLVKWIGETIDEFKLTIN